MPQNSDLFCLSSKVISSPSDNLWLSWTLFHLAHVFLGDAHPAWVWPEHHFLCIIGTVSAYWYQPICLFHDGWGCWVTVTGLFTTIFSSVLLSINCSESFICFEDMVWKRPVICQCHFKLLLFPHVLKVPSSENQIRDIVTALHYLI